MTKPSNCCSFARPFTIGCALLALFAPLSAHGQGPKPTAEFAPYIGVRQITDSLDGQPPPGAYVGRRLAADRTGTFGGRVAATTNNYGAAAGRIDLVDPQSGVSTRLGGSDLRIPTSVAMPGPGTQFPEEIYYFQMSDEDRTINRRVLRLAPDTTSGLGTLHSPEGVDAGTGLAFAPLSFGSKYGGQLFGSDSGNAPRRPSGDGIRRWDAVGTFTNEVMGPVDENPDTYVDVTFTGPEFGAHSNRLVGINTTGTGGENILMWTEAALLSGDHLAAYDAREVFYVAPEGSEPMKNATYGAYGKTGYLFAHDLDHVYRFNAHGKRVMFLSLVRGFNDVEFGANRTLYVADLYSGLYEVQPSPSVFATWLVDTGCPLAAAMADTVKTWKVGEACVGASFVCEAASQPSCGKSCLDRSQRATIVAAVDAICESPC